MIKFDSVVKRYPDGTTAVDGLDLVAPSGQITVLVGPSGCGKTTSLRMVNRMVEPTSGTVWLDDRDTASVPAAELRRGIGYVIQQAGLFPHRTIARQHRDRPAAARLGQAQGQAAGDGADGAGRAADRARPALPGPALRRPAAAGRRRPRAGRRPAGDADGRAVQRGRPGRPGRAAERVPPAAVRARQDHPVRHPRHRRGGQARRPGRRDAGRRQAGPAGRPRPSCSPPRRTTSWPASSAATAATGRSASAPPATCRWPASRTVPLGADQAEAARAATGRLGARGRRRRTPAGLGRRTAAAVRARPSGRSCCTAAAPWRRRTTRCGPRSTPRCRRRPAAA